MNRGFRIFNKAADDTAEILLYDEIGMWGVSAGDFVKDLQAIKAKHIDLRLNTRGGEVFDGLAIYNALLRHTATITVHVDALAASIASVIAMAGDRILIDRYAKMMIHEAHTVAAGCARDLHEMAGLLDEYSGNIAAIYAGRAGGVAAEWRERMRAETWFSADEAVAAGLADEVSGLADPRKTAVAGWRAPSPLAEAPEATLPPADAVTPPSEPAPVEPPVAETPPAPIPTPVEPPAELVAPAGEPEEDPMQPDDDWSDLVETLTKDESSEDDEFAALVEAM